MTPLFALLLTLPCPRYMVAVVGDCTPISCTVQFTNGLYGTAKRPVAVGDMVEVCRY